MNSVFSDLLGDRLILREVSKDFVEFIQASINNGTSFFNITQANIVPVFCSSLNKHTCVNCPRNDSRTIFLIIDEHHLELLGAMNQLFYLYGHNDIKQPKLSIMLNNILKTPKKRLIQVAAILLSEKSLLDGNSTRALEYLNIMNENKVNVDDYEGEPGELDFNWFILKNNRAVKAHSMAMTFYVYHELAHIKTILDFSSTQHYRNMISDIIIIIKSKSEAFKIAFESSTISFDDLVCDLIALDIMAGSLSIDKNSQLEYLVDAYISSVTNLTIMDSISFYDNKNNHYINGWIRIIITLNALGICGQLQRDGANYLTKIQKQMEYSFMTYCNYYEKMQNEIQELKCEFGMTREKYSRFTSEWKEELKSALLILAKIK